MHSKVRPISKMSRGDSEDCSVMAKVSGSSASTSSSSDKYIINNNSGNQDDIITRLRNNIKNIGGDVNYRGDVNYSVNVNIGENIPHILAKEESIQKSTNFYDVARKVARRCVGLPGVLIACVLIAGVIVGVLRLNHKNGKVAVDASSGLSPIKGKVAMDASLSATPGNNCSWLSPSGDFAFGFRQLENSEFFLLCIWFAKIPDRTIVWYANGDRLAPNGSYVNLTANSGLVLTSPSGKQLWKSNQTNVAHGFMHDTGNFVLEDDNSESLWETFKNPTDTMLPGQIIEKGGKLSSRQSETNYASGRFQLDFQQDGNLVFSDEKPFYSTRTTKGKIFGSEGKQLVFNDSGNFYILRVNGERFNFTDKECPARDYYYLRLTLNFEGVLAQYFLPKPSVGNESWKALWSDQKVDSDAGVCGDNSSICNLNADSRLTCECPRG